jgi:Zn-dependent protease with chaperone function
VQPTTTPMTPFRGRESLRVHGENATFVWTLLSLPLSILVIGAVLQHQVTYSQLALLVVIAMVYVAFARGRLLGAGLRVHAGQFAHVHAVVEECARMLRMPVPHVFVRDDPFVPVVGIGIGAPYAIVISAQFVEHFSDDELRFLIGRELGHIASGHTRFSSLLSSNGRENGVIAVAFGAWLRKIDYTADRVGLLCCGSLETALRAIAVSTFHSVGRKIDLGAFAAQLKELNAEPSLRMAEWTASTPYATNRVAALHRFARDPLYLTWSARFAANAAASNVTETSGPAYAGFGRRAWALAIDVVVIQTLIPAVNLVSSPSSSSKARIAKELAADKDTTGIAQALWSAQLPHFANDALLWIAFLVYVIGLVALAGQTFGMMVSDLRVVGVDQGARIGLRRAMGRYVSFLASLCVLVGWWSIFRRVQPFEQWSRTRLVSGGTAVRS